MRNTDARLDEIVGLARAIDLTVVEALAVPIGEIRPATYLGKGKVEEIVGLIAGRATVDSGPTKGRYFVFAGVDRIREMLAVPERHPVDYEPKYRPDGITVMKPIKQ